MRLGIHYVLMKPKGSILGPHKGPVPTPVTVFVAVMVPIRYLSVPLLTCFFQARKVSMSSRLRALFLN